MVATHFTAAYKERIDREADACTKPEQLGARLGRESIYSASQIASSK